MWSVCYPTELRIQTFFVVISTCILCTVDMHNPANRSIRLVLISVASQDGMLKSIAGLSSSIKFCLFNTHLIFTWVRRLRDSQCFSQSKMFCPRTVSTMTLAIRLAPDHLHHDQFELLIKVYLILLLGDICICVKLCLKFLCLVSARFSLFLKLLAML